MTRAWLEIDRIGAHTRSTPLPWTRVSLAEPLSFIARVLPAHEDEHRFEVDLVPSRTIPIHIVFDVHHVGDRWLLRPRSDIYRNGVQLRGGQKYALDNGDRIEPVAGTWVRFLDDTVPLPFPRLRQVGRAFLFAPTPADGADHWRAIMRGREELLGAELVDPADVDEDTLLRAFPFVRDVVHTPRGIYAITQEAAGVSLAALLARTREQGASLDELVVDEVRASCSEALEHARVAGWPRTHVYAETVIVTWEGRVLWLGFAAPGREMSPLSLHASSIASTGASGEASGEDARRVIAGVVARLFPEEHAAEMALREEVTLWTRDGLAELERATRGRPAP